MLASYLALGLFFLALILAAFGLFLNAQLAKYLKTKYPTEWTKEIHKDYWMIGRGGTGEWYRLLDSMNNHQDLAHDPFVTQHIKLIRIIKICAISLLVLLLAIVLFYKR